MVRATVLLVMLVVLYVAAPARAGVLEVSDGVPGVTFIDPAGVPDDLRVEQRSRDQPFTVLGATVTAGRGCVAVPGGASCPLPDGVASLELGGGDDVVVATVVENVFIYGGAGDDRLTLAAGDRNTLAGMGGDDVLVAAGRARLQGDFGNDRLSAGAPSTLSGGWGDDRLDGSPGNDVLVDAGDPHSRDVIDCGGGVDVLQGDPRDIRKGCSSAALNAISRVRYFWDVHWRPGVSVSVPERLRVKLYNYEMVTQLAFATCHGAACHRARFDYVPNLRDIRGGFESFRIVSGGKRARIDRRMWHGVGPGAIVRVGLRFSLDYVVFTKGYEFRTRAHALPVARKRCTVSVVNRPTRVVPCT